MSKSKKEDGLFFEVKQALGIKNRDLIKLGLHEAQFNRWNNGGFPHSTQVLFNLLIEKLNMITKATFVTYFVRAWEGRPSKVRIRSQIIGMQKMKGFEGKAPQNWLSIDLTEEIFEKLERKWQNRK